MSIKDFQLTGDKVLIREDKAPEKSLGGIVLPGTSKRAHQVKRGTIVARGKGRRESCGDKFDVLIPLSFEVGQHVIYSPYNNIEIEEDRETYSLIREPDILVVLKS